MRGVWLRSAGGAVMMAGGLAWIVTFLRLAAEHPSLDDPLVLWPFRSMEALALGVLLLRLGHWAPASAASSGVGAVIVSMGVAGVVPLLTVIASLPFLLGTLIFGTGLARLPATRLPGIVIAVGMALFIATRPWMLGAVQTGDALRAQEIVERSLAILLGCGWILLGIICLRDERRASAGIEGGAGLGTTSVR